MTSLRSTAIRKHLLLLLFGISSGLPLFAINSTLQAWMTDSGVDLTTIGIFALVGLPYTIKFLWAPLLDVASLSRLGRRRSWVLVAQCGVAFGFLALARLDPATQPWLVAFTSLCIAFMSATQDIALDAYRREILPDSQIGLATALFVNGYRVGILLSGAGALSLADQIPWRTVYTILAALAASFMVITLVAPEPDPPPQETPSLQSAVIAPLKNLLVERGALWALAFIVAYKLGDTVANQMSTPFFLDVGYSKTAVAAIAKTFGVIATLTGSLIAGTAMTRMTIRQALVTFGILQLLSTLSYLLPIIAGPSTANLVAVIAIENGTGGMGTTALTAYMAMLCNRRFTATQYALLSSLAGVPRVFLSAPSGALASAFGWGPFFVLCSLIALPGLLLIRSARAPQQGREQSL